MIDDKIAQMKNAHKILAEFDYEPVELERGYANRTLRIDISTNKIEIEPVTQQMKDLWIGGRGFDLWLTFKEINKNTKWDSLENPICFSCGPLGGVTSFPGSGKTIVTAVSPLTGAIIDCNVGGYFGPYLKFAGFDALMVIGKASEDIIILIDAEKNKITIETAPMEHTDSHILAEQLTKMYAKDKDDKRNIAIVSSGSAADNIRMGILNFSFYDWRRQSVRFKQAARGGIGTVLRNKKIKALIVKNKEFIPAWRVDENKVEKWTSTNICKDCAGKTDRQKIRQIIEKWNRNPEYVIEMLQDVQDTERFISRDAIDEISRITRVPKGALYHIATFYKAFSLSPRGETVIQVCTGTTCHVKGSAKILEAFERKLGITTGQTTRDGKFTLEAVGCLGCCALAPVATIGKEVHGHLQAKDVEKII